RLQRRPGRGRQARANRSTLQRNTGLRPEDRQDRTAVSERQGNGDLQGHRNRRRARDRPLHRSQADDWNLPSAAIRDCVSQRYRDFVIAHRQIANHQITQSPNRQIYSGLSTDVTSIPSYAGPSSSVATTTSINTIAANATAIGSSTTVPTKR